MIGVPHCRPIGSLKLGVGWQCRRKKGKHDSRGAVFYARSSGPVRPSRRTELDSRPRSGRGQALRGNDKGGCSQGDCQAVILDIDPSGTQRLLGGCLVFFFGR